MREPAPKSDGASRDSSDRDIIRGTLAVWWIGTLCFTAMGVFIVSSLIFYSGPVSPQFVSPVSGSPYLFVSPRIVSPAP